MYRIGQFQYDDCNPIPRPIPSFAMLQVESIPLIYGYTYTMLYTPLHTHTQTTVNIVQFVDFLSSKGASKDEAMEVRDAAS